MGGLLHLVQRGGAWAGWGPAQSPPFCTKCNSPTINGQWIISLFGLVLRSAESLSEFTGLKIVQGVIILGIYMSSKYLFTIIIDNRILNFLDCILIGKMSSIFTGVKMEDTSNFERRDAVNTFIFGEILPACAKEYLTSATYYCQAEVRVAIE